MKSKNSRAAGRAEQAWEKLRHQLAQVGPLSQGSVQDRTGRQGGGAGYQWTRKVAGKTVSVALSAAQYEAMKRAVANYQDLRRLLKKMEALSRRIIFQTIPHPGRHKKLSQKVLGTN